MKSTREFIHKACIGNIYVAENNDKIIYIGFRPITEQPSQNKTELVHNVCLQIDQYLNRERREFDIPFSLCVSPFRQKVCSELMKIPYGQTRSYSQIAKNIGQPLASRAVGCACGKNPIAIVIPCHRVIGSNGTLTGYAGGLEVKKYLLTVEKVHSNFF